MNGPEETDWLEEELRRALAREIPPRDFTDSAAPAAMARLGGSGGGGSGAGNRLRLPRIPRPRSPPPAYAGI